MKPENTKLKNITKLLKMDYGFDISWVSLKEFLKRFPSLEKEIQTTITTEKTITSIVDKMCILALGRPWPCIFEWSEMDQKQKHSFITEFAQKIQDFGAEYDEINLIEVISDNCKDPISFPLF